MTAHPPDGSEHADSGLSRRQFLGAAAALFGGLVLPLLPGFSDATDAPETRGAGTPSRRPNIVILMTD